MYPLDAHYGTPILRFIECLRQHEDIVVQTNNLSTQLFGDYDQIMAALTREIRGAFSENPAVVMNLKIINLDLR